MDLLLAQKERKSSSRNVLFCLDSFIIHLYKYALYSNIRREFKSN